MTFRQKNPIALLALLGLSGCGGMSLAEQSTVTAFGDSHTHGGLDDAGNYTLPSWVEEFRKNIKFRYVNNYSAPGATVSSTSPQFPSILAHVSGRMKLCVFMPGTNDNSDLGDTAAGAAIYKSQLMSAIVILADHFETVLIGTQPQEILFPNFNTDRYAQATRDAITAVNRPNVHLADVHSDYVPVASEYWTDNFHFTEVGLKKIADVFQTKWDSLQ